MWRNAGGTNYWLKVKLDRVTSNKVGIGARMKATVKGQEIYRYVLCGEAFLGQNSGTEIFTQKQQSNQASIDVSNISSGIFFLEIRTKTAKTVQKVVIH